MISADTTIAALLEAHPQLLDFLASYHAHFEKLRDPALRKVMAPRTTVAQAAQIVGIDAAEFVAALRRAVGTPASDTGAVRGGRGPALGTPLAPDPARLAPRPLSGDDIPNGLRSVALDVRDDVTQGREPFLRIMTALKTLGADECLTLRVPFEPIPLYDVARKRGFAHATERRTADDWMVTFYRAEPAAKTGEATPTAPAAAGQPRTVTIDVRDLEPPQPMVRVLEQLDRLTRDDRLEVIHDRRPMLLYPQLDERGFVHETDEPAPGVVRIMIRRGAA